MDKRLVNRFRGGIVLKRGCPNVSLLKEEYFVIVCDKYPQPDVELSVIDEKWPLKVFLDNECISLYHVGQAVKVREVR